MSAEIKTNITAERVREAIEAAGTDIPTKLLISEAHLHTSSVSERVTERDIFRSEELSPEFLRWRALDLAVAAKRELYSKDLNPAAITEIAREFYSFLADGTVSEITSVTGEDS